MATDSKRQKRVHRFWNDLPDTGHRGSKGLDWRTVTDLAGRQSEWAIDAVSNPTFAMTDSSLPQTGRKYTYRPNPLCGVNLAQRLEGDSVN